MVSVPINFILLVFTWLSFTSHNNNHKVLIHFFVETSSTRETLLGCLELVSQTVQLILHCVWSQVLDKATQRPYLLKLSKTRLVLQQTTTKQMIIRDYHSLTQIPRYLGGQCLHIVLDTDIAKKVNYLEVALHLRH